MGIRVGVVADDVTGANDIGSTFGNGGFRSAVFPLNLIEGRDMEEETQGLDAIIIDTDSRFDTAVEAAEKVQRAVEILKRLSCDRYFKKTCSVFRGNIGAEFDSMQKALGEKCAMVILGFPKNGRTTLEGIHYVYGEKLENSQFRKDPIHPMTTSFLPDILHQQSEKKVGIVTFRDLDMGISHVLCKKDQLKKECAYIVFDIRGQEDLKLVAKAVSGERMLCGSSAIGEMLPEVYGKLCREKVLAAAGSLTRQSLSQIRYLEKIGWKSFILDGRAVFEENVRLQEEQRLIALLTEAFEHHDQVLLHTWQEPEGMEEIKTRAGKMGLTSPETGKLISGSLCRVIRGVLERTGIRNLVVAGGDTSAAVSFELEVYRMEIGREIETGVPAMTGKSSLGILNLVLKSGSFGSEEFLQKAADALRGKWDD